MQNNSIYTEELLVSLLKSKSEEGMRIIYKRYAPALFGMVKKIVQSDEVAEDVIQDAFVKIWKNAELYDSSKGKLFTWMYNVTRNLSLDKIESKDFRNASKNLNLENSVQQINEEKHLEVHVDGIDVKDWVHKLNPDHQQVIDLMYFKGYTQAEIAEQLDMPIGSVKTKIRLALIQLRNFFDVK